jgi:hypothetical protein
MTYAAIGFITKVDDDTFTARLTDLHNRCLEEEVEIYIKSVEGYQRNLIQEGTTIAVTVTPDSTDIRLVKPEEITKEDIEQANKMARSIRELFGWV